MNLYPELIFAWLGISWNENGSISLWRIVNGVTPVLSSRRILTTDIDRFASVTQFLYQAGNENSRRGKKP